MNATKYRREIISQKEKNKTQKRRVVGFRDPFRLNRPGLIRAGLITNWACALTLIYLLKNYSIEKHILFSLSFIVFLRS